MNQRKVFFGGNWKSNNTLVQTKKIIEDVLDNLTFDPQRVGKYLFYADVVVAPIYLHLFTVQYTKKNKDIHVAAQNCSKYGCGAYTG
jgi:triosephosphate isomerase